MIGDSPIPYGVSLHESIILYMHILILMCRQMSVSQITFSITILRYGEKIMISSSQIDLTARRVMECYETLSHLVLVTVHASGGIWL